jgi:hypothetical protein
VTALPQSNTPPARSSRAIAHEREQQVLLAIALCGYLTTRLIALWVWDTSTEHVARNKTQLVLNRLEARRLVVRRLAQNGDVVWILGRAGAQMLNDQREADGLPPLAQAGHDLGFTAIEKDKLAIAHALELRNRSHAQERGVIGRAGLRAGIMPDCLDCDAVLIERDDKGVLKVTAIMAAPDARETLVKRVASIQQRGRCVELAGEQKTVVLLRKRVAAELRSRA